VGVSDYFNVPIVGAPMAGGASTAELVAAVHRAGGLGFVAAGYLAPETTADLVRRAAARAPGRFGVNLFVPGADTADPSAVAAYGARLAADADRLGAALGPARWDDDHYPAKLALLTADPVPVVGFTFGCPEPSDVRALRRAGSTVLVTVTTAGEARAAAEAGADALVVQGAEAGGHQGSFEDTYERTTPLLDLLAEVRAAVDLPLVAAGGIACADDVRRVLAAGAAAAQVGTVLLRTPESGASRTHKDALADPRFTATTVTRAFSGRRARALVNRFVAAHDRIAPGGYPQVHHLTAPLRAAAARAGDSEHLHLWAGTGFRAADDRPAAEVVASLTTAL
jgi:nitronate monooxygenase